MAIERTLALVKPDAVERNLIGKIISRIEEAGLWLVGARMLRLTKEEAKRFYEVHKGRPFYEDLTDYMSSGPIMAMALEGEEAITKWRDLMGATNPVDAAPGTIRAEFGMNVEKNSTHGSDSPKTAVTELNFFFNQMDYV